MGPISYNNTYEENTENIIVSPKSLSVLNGMFKFKLFLATVGVVDILKNTQKT